MMNFIRLAVVGIVMSTLPIYVFATPITFNFTASDNSGNSLSGTIVTNGGYGVLDGNTNLGEAPVIESYNLTGTGSLFGSSGAHFTGDATTINNNNGHDALCVLSGPAIDYCNFTPTTSTYLTQFDSTLANGLEDISIEYSYTNNKYYWVYGSNDPQFSALSIGKLDIAAQPASDSASVPSPPSWQLMLLGFLLLIPIFIRKRSVSEGMDLCGSEAI